MNRIIAYAHSRILCLQDSTAQDSYQYDEHYSNVVTGVGGQCVTVSIRYLHLRYRSTMKVYHRLGQPYNRGYTFTNAQWYLTKVQLQNRLHDVVAYRPSSRLV
jgi:hypothetical protein